MTTVQIIGVSVAGAALLLLIIALLVTRRRDDDDGEQDEVRTGPSFLDEGPQDTFSRLGKPEHPVEDITLDPAAERALAAERAAAAAQPAQEEREPQPGGLGLDWGPDLSVRELAPEPVVQPSWDDGPEGNHEERPADESEVTGELRPDDESEVTGELRGAAPPQPREADGTPAAEDAEQEPGGEGDLVPLSDIIVTTSSKMVDLHDPEVRRMLTELVTFEIDQAADFRRRGQTIDAVLQLTEAEKVSRALGMDESAKRIRAMMKELRQAE